MLVHDIDRPDVAGVAPKMQAIADACREQLHAPFLQVSTDDNLCSSVSIKGSSDAKGEWENGIWQNSRYFHFNVSPLKGKRYYDDSDPKVTVQLYSGCRKEAKFRKYTAPVHKVIAKIQSWIDAE